MPSGGPAWAATAPPGRRTRLTGPVCPRQGGGERLPVFLPVWPRPFWAVGGASGAHPWARAPPPRPPTRLKAPKGPSVSTKGASRPRRGRCAVLTCFPQLGAGPPTPGLGASVVPRPGAAEGPRPPHFLGSRPPLPARVCWGHAPPRVLSGSRHGQLGVRCRGGMAEKGGPPTLSSPPPRLGKEGSPPGQSTLGVPTSAVRRRPCQRCRLRPTRGRAPGGPAGWPGAPRLRACWGRWGRRLPVPVGGVTPARGGGGAATPSE